MEKQINMMLDAMKEFRERDISHIRKTLKNNGLLTQTREDLNVELHRLNKEIEALEEVRTRCKFICEDYKCNNTNKVKQLDLLGIRVYDENGERSMLEILEEIKNVWGSLTDSQKECITGMFLN